MARNFIEFMGGNGRCRIRDSSYSRERLEEVRAHCAQHHRPYLAACDGVGAPVNRSERARMMEEGPGYWLAVKRSLSG
jgi:hypothetical protein